MVMAVVVARVKRERGYNVGAWVVLFTWEKLG